MMTKRLPERVQRLNDDVERLARGETPAEPPDDREYRELVEAAQVLSRELRPLREARPGYQAQLAARLQVQLPQARCPRWRSLFAVRRPIVPSPRLAILAAVVVVLLVFAGGTVATVPLVTRSLNQSSKTQRIVADGLGKEVNLASTVDGFTVTLERVYADPGMIAIGFTISSPPGHDFKSFNVYGNVFGQGSDPTLTDGRGHTYSLGPHGFQFNLGTGVEGGTTGNVLIYDAAGLPGGSGEISLHLSIAALSVYEQVAPDHRPAGTSYCGEQTSPIRCFNVAGPFTFDFIVPVAPGRVIAPRQAVTADGRTVTLERVILTRTVTRVDLRGVGPDADVRLIVDGVEHQLPAPSVRYYPPLGWPADGVFSYISAEPSLDQHGAATLVVKPGQHPQSPPTVTGGPWVFHVTLP